MVSFAIPSKDGHHLLNRPSPFQTGHHFENLSSFAAGGGPDSGTLPMDNCTSITESATTHPSTEPKSPTPTITTSLSQRRRINRSTNYAYSSGQKMRSGIVVAFLLCTSAFVQQLASSGWIRESKNDSFSGTFYLEFTLSGKFLDRPKYENTAVPTLRIRCQPGKHSVGYHVYAMGRTVSSALVIGDVVDAHGFGTAAMYRLDDGKPQTEIWQQSTDFAGVFFSESTLRNILYSHILPHKENSNAPTRKLVIAVDENGAGKVVMQFDLPDPTELADACGQIIHKQSN
jgi:hypothetical protein